MAKRKHYDVIVAWANGAEVEVRSDSSTAWHEIETPAFLEEMQYRIKQRTFTERAWYPVTLKTGLKVVAQYTKGQFVMLLPDCGAVCWMDASDIPTVGEEITAASWEEVCKQQ